MAGVIVRGDVVAGGPDRAVLRPGAAVPGAALLRRRRQKAFGAQFPDALDIIVRSLRAGHPVPIAISMVAREMPDPIGSEFGIVADEITYGADLESGMRNLYFRVGQDDLPLFVTAVAIQGTTGGNLGEILQNLSTVIRQRFKMRRKIRALAAEARASALILSSLPIGIFVVIQIVTPDFYASVWDERHHQDGAGGRRLPGCWSAISSCTGWSISGSEPWIPISRLSSTRVRRRLDPDAGRAGVPRDRRPDASG